MFNVLQVTVENFGTRESFLEEVCSYRNNVFSTIFLMPYDGVADDCKYWNDSKVYVFPAKPANKILKGLLNYFMDLRYIWHIAKIVREEQINIIQVRDITFPLFIALLFKFSRGIKVVYQKSYPHELRKISEAKKYKLFFLAYMSRMFENFLLHKMMNYCDAVFPISESMAQDLKKKYNVTRTELVHFGMGMNFHALDKYPVVPSELPNDRFRLIYNGTLCDRRELHHLIDAFVLLRTKYDRHDLELLFVGGTDAENLKLKKKVPPGYLNETVKFLGFVDRMEVYRLILQSHIGISYIPDNEIFKVACPTKLIEYLAFGVPVVATDTVIEQIEIMQKTGAGVLSTEHADDLALKMNELLDDYDNYKNRAMNAREYIKQNYNYVTMREQIMEIYKGMFKK